MSTGQLNSCDLELFPAEDEKMMPESQNPTSASHSRKNGRWVVAIGLLAVAAAISGGMALTRKAAPDAVVAESSAIVKKSGAPGAMWELSTPGAANAHFSLAHPAAGVYNIQSVQEVPYGTNKLVLNSAGGGKKNETNIQLYTNPTSLDSQWLIQPVPDGGSDFFTVENINAPSLYLNLAGGGSYGLTNVQLYGNPGSRDSQWTFYKVHGTHPEEYLIQATNGMYLNAASNTKESNVLVSSYTGVPSRWILTPFPQLNKKADFNRIICPFLSALVNEGALEVKQVYTRDELTEVTLKSGLPVATTIGHVAENFRNNPFNVQDIFAMEGASNEHKTSTGIHDCVTTFEDCGWRRCRVMTSLPAPACGVPSQTKFDNFFTTCDIDSNDVLTVEELTTCAPPTDRTARVSINDQNPIGGGTIAGSFEMIMNVFGDGATLGHHQQISKAAMQEVFISRKFPATYTPREPFT